MSDTKMVTEEDKAIPRNISMFSDQWAYVEEINERYDLRNVSGAVRHIINEYRRMTAKANGK
jgi:hypothetical protein